MSNDVILSVQNASIRYRVGDIRNIGLKEVLMQKLTGRRRVKDFWADRHISFELRRGDFLGVIGVNGAGKSTLLKAITGVLKPTIGRIRCNGRVTALLELASGFDGDLSVRENAYLRGALLGYTRKFMDETYPAIVEFAELKDFEDRSFRQLSSGMRARLAFSIASMIDPEILILDEVLSVGDGAFRMKSEEKMKSIIANGATTIFVSHNLAQIRKLCNKILWLHKGEQICFTDDVSAACDCYDRFLKNRSTERPLFIPPVK